MSIWGDIHRRSNGIQERREDLFQDNTTIDLDFTSLYHGVTFHIDDYEKIFKNVTDLKEISIWKRNEHLG